MRVTNGEIQRVSLKYKQFYKYLHLAFNIFKFSCFPCISRFSIDIRVAGIKDRIDKHGVEAKRTVNTTPVTYSNLNIFYIFFYNIISVTSNVRYLLINLNIKSRTRHKTNGRACVASLVIFVYSDNSVGVARFGNSRFKRCFTLGNCR